MVKSRKPWEGTSWIKQRTMPKVPQIKNNGQVVNSLDLLFDKMHEQFAQSALLPAATDFIKGLPQRDIRPWSPFSALKLNDALLTCSNASAPGPSHLYWEYLKLLLKDDQFRTFFLQLANDLIQCGVWPDVFKDSVTVIIPKPNKEDYSKAKSYQPIALLECPCKLISKIIANRLQSDAIVYNIAHLLQFGGLCHHSTIDAGLYVTEYITKACNTGLYTMALALDAAQFFPSLNKEIIVKLLLKEEFNPILLPFFNDYYSGRSTQYLWNQ